MTFNGVIDKTTGDLLRAGFCDFQNDGSFDAATEETKSDVPRSAKVKGELENSQLHRWNGTDWVLVDR